MTDPLAAKHFRSAEPSPESQFPKRFYETVEIVEDDGFAIRLDGRPVRTPGRAVVAAPNRPIAEAIAAEWEAQSERVDPRTMPATRLANTALDGVANEPQAVREDIVRYAGSDLICYRADGPAGLVAREAEVWDPFLDWAQRDLSANLILAEGIVHVAQPREALAAIGAAVRQVDEPFALASLHVMTALTGSAVIALAVQRGHVDVGAAWSAAHVDEDWNIAEWGEDAEAAERRAKREAEMRVAALFATAAA